MAKDKTTVAEPEKQPETLTFREAAAIQQAELPPPAERNVQATFDKLNLNEKLNLTPEQSATLKGLETAFIKGDLKSVEGTLHKFNKDPDALKPVMDVLAKDLKAVGIRADYSVDFALNNDGKAERTGMFGLTTAITPEDWMTKESKEMCIYTNPNAGTWADHMVPVHRGNALESPQSNKIPADDGFRDIAKYIAGTASSHTKK